MRTSELITLYLATAAPFGVAFFLRHQERHATRRAAFARATGAALMWPLTAVMLLLERQGAKAEHEAETGKACATFDEMRIEQARRELINSLRAIEDLLEAARVFGSEVERHALFAARDVVERYVGLSVAVAGAEPDDAPSAREMELCRLAGRAGDDLLLAGRCIHRRSVSRLLAHRERARAEFVVALAHVCRTVSELLAAGNARAQEAQRVSESVLHALGRAIELLSLFDDWQTVPGVARLLDAECARLRSFGTGESEKASLKRAEGEDRCTTPAALEAFAAPRPQTTTSTQG